MLIASNLLEEHAVLKEMQPEQLKKNVLDVLNHVAGLMVVLSIGCAELSSRNDPLTRTIQVPKLSNHLLSNAVGLPISLVFFGNEEQMLIFEPSEQSANADDTKDIVFVAQEEDLQQETEYAP